MTKEAALARAVFDEIRGAVPELAVRESETGEGEPEVVIPEQTGLRFEVGLYLYDDVLNLCAGQFWGEWFPCSDPAVVSRYFEAVTGLLGGRFRIVEHWHRGLCSKAFLQRPETAGWKTVSRCYRGLSLPWPRLEQRFLHNVR